MKHNTQMGSRDISIDVAKEYLSGCVIRAKWTALVCSVCYLSFGFTSYSTIKSFYPSLQLINNIWPRFLFVSLPFIFLFQFMRSSAWRMNTKLAIWALAFAIINFVSASIHVWPLALNNAQVLLYFSSVNLLIFTVSSLYIAFPFGIYIIYYLLFALFFFSPLLYIAKGDDLVFSSLANDIISYSAANFALSAFFKKYLLQFLREKMTKIARSSFFLDEDIKSAIDSGIDIGNLEKPRSGFIFPSDIRGYTDFLTHNEAIKRPDINIDFTKKVSKFLRGIVRSFGAKTHKTAGDGYYFLSMDAIPLDEIEFMDEVKDAEINNRKYRLANLIRAYIKISQTFNEMVRDEGYPKHMVICGAIHFGSLQYSILGLETEGEYDVVSVDLIRATRLEEYTKYLRTILGVKDYLIISETAYQYFDRRLVGVDLHEFDIPADRPIRNFPECKKIYYYSLDKSNQQSLDLNPISSPLNVAG